MKKSPLYENHLALNAKMLPFAGYEMPIQYEGIVSEHLAVRTAAGLFDVSHMGEICISGKNAEYFLNKMTINDVSKLSVDQAQYTAICNGKGGIIDDLILYKYENHFMVVTNASNHEKDLAWLKSHIMNHVKIEDKSEAFGLIALQGPKSRDILQKSVLRDLSRLKFYHFIETEIEDIPVTIARTGYTGELGFELYIPSEKTCIIWEKLLELGQADGIKPIGLGARDTLRLEMKYCLYGNDINEETNPFEAGLAWITKLDKDDFVGKESLLKAKSNISRKLVSFIMTERAIPRQGNVIYLDNEVVGEVTSGTQSPSLQKGIGLGYVNIPYHKFGQTLNIDIRGKRKSAEVVKAFISKN